MKHMKDVKLTLVRSGRYIFSTKYHEGLLIALRLDMEPRIGPTWLVESTMIDIRRYALISQHLQDGSDVRHMQFFLDVEYQDIIVVGKAKCVADAKRSLKSCLERR